jgi:DNA-binding HxlR family transcriptional regulator
MIDDAILRRLTASRWLVPVMALLGEESGARFAVMLNRLGLPRSSLTVGLAQLIEAGWVIRNPRHGHPLRPEYVLTREGTPIAAFCQGVMRQRTRLRLEAVDLPRWSLPVLSRIDRGDDRFSALRTRLRPITPRALSLTLKQLVACELVGRRLEDRFPPATLYDLTARGRELAGALR